MELQMLLLTRCLLYGTAPSLASWEEYSLVVGPYFQSCGSWEGGGLALVQAFEKELCAHGVTIRCGAKVTALEADKEGMQAVLLADGQRIATKHCYFTGHPAQLQQLLPKGMVRPAWFNRIAEMPETPPAFMLFARTHALAPGHSRYLLPSLPAVPSASFSSGTAENDSAVYDSIMAPLGSAYPSL